MSKTEFLHNQANNCLHYGEYKINYSVKESNCQSDSMLIKVHPDCRVTINIPSGTTEQEIKAAIKKRARWIFKHWNDFNEQANPVLPRSYCSGESHYYLGRQHLLKVFVNPLIPAQVKLLRGKLEITIPEKSSEKVKRMLNQWYADKARDVFDRRLQLILEKTLWVNDKPEIRLQTMRKQWGSCSPDGQLTLNPNLVKAPRECIDYVLLHELCHIAEHNHSEKFYRLMRQVMPGWEIIKKKLDEKAASILNGIE